MPIIRWFWVSERRGPGLIGLLACALAALAAGDALARDSLTPFRSDAELSRFLKARVPARHLTPGLEEVVVTAQRAESVTNNQVAGVDEGDIVKARGETLVILRRGRLFSVSTAGGGLRAVAAIDAFPPGTPGDGWYDEMLVLRDRVVVIGYSYAREGTVINRFRLAPDGALSFEDSYRLRSDDYYSSRNYASRLIGKTLVLYTPLGLSWGDDPLEVLPAIERWTPGARGLGFRRIARASQIFIPARLKASGAAEIDALHAVTTCRLDQPVLRCAAVGVLGPYSRNFYVSANAVYLWTPNDHEDDDGKAEAMLYRLPLMHEPPQAVAVRGAPEDQFSFREEPWGLSVLVRSEGLGEGMWRAETSEGDVALVGVPFEIFGDGSAEVPRSRYRPLPRPKGDGDAFHNRFAGDYVLYGLGRDWEDAAVAGELIVASVLRGPVATFSLPHPIDRIEPIGSSAVVVGASKVDLNLSAVELDGRPRLGDRYVYAGAAEGETRSHAFMFRPDAGSPGGADGILGLPVVRPERAGYEQLREDSAAMMFLRWKARRFSSLGDLPSAAGEAEDNCQASCLDWYGNARPIFLGGRIFALLGYELVEGRIEGGQLREIARVNFSPASSFARHPD